jgi:rRNA maturation endonuclease Nob1
VSSNINASCLKYEELPTKAEQRALKSRREWMAHHVDDVSQMFSKLSISPADIQTLLHTIESDQTVVQAAYYTDDHCIARIADWLAVEGDPMHRLN